MSDPLFTNALVGFCFLLLAAGIAELYRRIASIEKDAKDHDKWAAEKAERLSYLESSFQSILRRFDRLDGHIDVINQKLDRNGRQ